MGRSWPSRGFLSPRNCVSFSSADFWHTTPYGFDVEKEIAAITLNRWSHGYAYEFENIGEPAEYDRHNGPHIAGRAQVGRISIANSDSEAYAFVDGAIDSADRAVNEQLEKT